MAVEELTALLAHMDEIANAVNAFKSEDVQKDAFAALVAAFVGSDTRSSRFVTAAENQDDQTAEEDAVDQDQNTAQPPKKRRKSNGTPSKAGVAPVRDLDLRPTGKQSFIDFVTEKSPTSNQEKYAVAVYYLEHILELSPVTAGHVAAVFKQTSHWRESGNIAAGLRVTAARKNTINVSDLNDIKTTAHGRNFVEHDLPGEEKQGK